MERRLLSFDLGDLVFQYRVAAVALADAHLLVARARGTDFCFLPGGRVEAGETATEALAREMREELGAEVAVGRLLWVVEEFFSLGGRRYHEICLIFAATPPAPVRDPSFARHDPQDGIDLFSAPIAALERLRLQPAFLRAAVAAPPPHPAHVVVRD